MTANTLPASTLTLGGFLRDCRARLPPGAEAQSRRRTPELRREEVATRAGVSVTWYTWLEQGRGGPPSELRASHNCGTKCHVPALEEGVETAETPGDGFRAGWLVAA